MTTPSNAAMRAAERIIPDDYYTVTSKETGEFDQDATALYCLTMRVFIAGIIDAEFEKDREVAK